MDDYLNDFLKRHPEAIWIQGVLFLGLISLTAIHLRKLFFALKQKTLPDHRLQALSTPWQIAVGVPLFLLSQQFLSPIIFFIMTLTIVPMVLKLYGSPYQQQWGLNESTWLSALKIAGIVSLALLIPIQIFSFINVNLCLWLNLPIEPQPAIALFMESQDTNKILFFVLYATIAAPVSEEILFRGFLQPALKKHLGKNRALWISSLLFAAVHYHLPTFIPLTFLGLALGQLQESTGRLLPSILLHALFNSYTVAMLLIIRFV